MKESHEIGLAIVMIVVGSLVLQNNLWKQRMQTRIDSIKEERHTMDDFYPYVFVLSKHEEYTRVNLTSPNIVVYESLSTSEAVQWAIDNIPNNTGIKIVEDIIMDGKIDMIPQDNKSYGIFAKPGYLDFTKMPTSGRADQ